MSDPAKPAEEEEEQREMGRQKNEGRGLEQ